MDIKFNVFTADDSSFDTIAAFIYHLSKEGLMADRITIQDIADALGVSRNTVSKAINNPGGCHKRKSPEKSYGNGI